LIIHGEGIIYGGKGGTSREEGIICTNSGAGGWERNTMVYGFVGILKNGKYIHLGFLVLISYFLRFF
jgi:hypothetical protein